jgi:type VI secretion system secreted protein Hcp
MKRIPKYVIPLAFSALATIQSSSFAAVDMFLKLGDIQGEAQDAKHEGEIDVLAWSWSMSQTPPDFGGGGGAGRPLIRALSITKYIDASSAPIYMNLLTGKFIPEATLTVRKAGADPLEFIKIDMKDVLVTSTNPGGSGGEDRLSENISLNFREVCITYTEQSPQGGAGNEYQTCWNVETNSPQ